MTKTKALCFIFAGMAAGFVSGIFDPIFYGVRGAVLGGTLAMGLIVWRRYYEKEGQCMSIWRLHGIAIGVASLACALSVVLSVLLYTQWFPESYNAKQIKAGMESNLWIVHVLGTFVTCLFFAWGMLFCERSCALRQGRVIKNFFFFGMPALSVIPRAVSFGDTLSSGELPIGFLGTVIFCFVVGLLPFLLLWGIVARLFGFFYEKTYEESGKLNE